MKQVSTYLLLALVVLGISLSFQSIPVRAADETVQPFIVGVSDGPGKIDPADAYDSVSIDVITQVCEGLYAYNFASAEMESIPRLASAMGTWNTAKTELTIPLRQDVTFHDGSKFNATAVKWNFDRLFGFVAEEANTPSVLYYNDDGELVVNETVIVDEYTIKFILNKPWVVWEKILAFSGSFMIKPDPAFETTFLGVDDALIGTGPFMLDSYVVDEKVVFNAYPDYYRGEANIKQMIYQIIADDDARSMAFINKELHYGGVLPEYLATVAADPELTIEEVKTTVVRYVSMNVNNVPLAARKAIAHVINYSYYGDFIRVGAFELHTPVPDGMQYHNASIEGLPYYNVTKARAFILNDATLGAAATLAGLDASSTDAEWEAVADSDTPIASFNFTRYTSLTVQRVMTLIQDNCKDIGIKIVDFHIGDWSVWTEWTTFPGNKSTMDLSMGGWAPDYNDPINMIEPIFKTGADYNDAMVADAALDTLMGDTYSLTGADREAAFDELQKKIMVDMVPAAYLGQDMARVMYNNKYVSNVQDNLNVFNNWYFYNFVFTPDVVPGPKINGFEVSFMSIISLTVIALLYMRLRKH